jgi:DNA invertase Pin-like site-specific DNA recombinase
LAELKERGVPTSVCDLPNGEDMTGDGIAALLMGIMASVDEWERERFRERRRPKAAGEDGRFLGGRTPWRSKPSSVTEWS